MQRKYFKSFKFKNILLASQPCPFSDAWFLTTHACADAGRPKPEKAAKPEKPFEKPPKVELTKAERRALQEAQRAAKAEAAGAGRASADGAKKAGAAGGPDGGAKKGGQAAAASVEASGRGAMKSSGQPAAGAAPAPKAAADKKKGKGVSLNSTELFAHLQQFKHVSVSDVLSHKDMAHLHPAILQLGLKYADVSITGGNARCVAMLNAMSQVRAAGAGGIAPPCCNWLTCVTLVFATKPGCSRILTERQVSWDPMYSFAHTLRRFYSE